MDCRNDNCLDSCQSVQLSCTFSLNEESSHHKQCLGHVFTCTLFHLLSVCVTVCVFVSVAPCSSAKSVKKAAPASTVGDFRRLRSCLFIFAFVFWTNPKGGRSFKKVILSMTTTPVTNLSWGGTLSPPTLRNELILD